MEMGFEMTSNVTLDSMLGDHFSSTQGLDQPSKNYPAMTMCQCKQQLFVPLGVLVAVRLACAGGYFLANCLSTMGKSQAN